MTWHESRWVTTYSANTPNTQREWRQAQCSGCKTFSPFRPVGETPENWERDLEGQGRYWCSECVREGR